jgi:hypothetical protein
MFRKSLLLFALTLTICISTAPVTPIDKAMLTLTPYPTPFATKRPLPSITDEPEPRQDYRFIEALPDNAALAKFAGKLVVSDALHYNTSILDAATGNRRDLSFVGCLAVSPSGQWLAYCPSANDSSPMRLIIENAQGFKKIDLPINKDWWLGATWLDEEQLAINVWENRSVGYHRLLPMEVLNPFTRKSQVFESNYPGMKPPIEGPALSRVSFPFEYTAVVYNSNLDRAIYPDTANEEAFIVLWDIIHQKTVAKLEYHYGFEYAPLWSPDGSRFAIAVGVSHDMSILLNEWFLVTHDGKIEQVTKFADKYKSVETGAASWSPDGNYLAFWLDLPDGECVGKHLALLDLRTKHVIHYCNPNNLEGVTLFDPVWLPDSTHLLYQDYYDDIRCHLILLDIKQDRAWIVGENEIPEGWLQP